MAGTDRCHAHILPILFLTSAVVTSLAALPCGNSSVGRFIVTGSNHGRSSSGAMAHRRHVHSLSTLSTH